jgi:hypothetical protein
VADRSHTLLQAASTIFVLMTVLPLLIFTWTIYTLDGLQRDAAQIGLGLSLLISLTGFVILRAIMSQLSELSRGIVRAVGDQGTPPRPEPGSLATPAPGIGAIDEFDEMTATMAGLWQREAVAHVGHPVLVSLVRVPEPIAGTLQELTAAGLVLNRDGEDIKIAYQRIAGIEPASRPPAPPPTEPPQ